MAVLGNNVRLQLWRGVMRYWSGQQESVGAISKADLQAAINAADDWADSVASAYNSALPATFRTNATAGQKALVLAMVILARFNANAVRSILGEVD